MNKDIFKKQIPEKEIERAILAYLEARKIVAWKQNNACTKVQNRFIRNFMDARGVSIRGIPDIAGYLHDGRALFIEVKRHGAYPTKEQRAFLENAKKHNCLAFVARSIDDVEVELSKLGTYLSDTICDKM